MTARLQLAADPRALRARIATLERELAAAKTARPPVVTVEIPVLSPEELETLRGFVDRIHELQGAVRDAFDRLVTATHHVHRDQAGAYAVPAGSGERGVRPLPATIPSPSAISQPSAPARANDPLGGRARARQPASMNGKPALLRAVDELGAGT